MKNINILYAYAGCGISGRRTSLEYISNNIVPSFDILDKAHEGWKFPWYVGNKVYNLYVSVSVFRSWLYYQKINDVLHDARFKPEINFLRIVDGLVFLVDSQKERMEANIEFLERTRIDLQDLGRDSSEIPIVFQLNKRDLPNIETVEEIKQKISWPKCAFVESVATRGEGVAESLNKLLGLIKHS